MTGIILAGGRNSRMQGRNKAFLMIEGERFIERQIREMSRLCDHVVIIANDPASYDFCLSHNIACFSDIDTGHGPISGFHAAFSNNIDTEYAWVVGCDYPMLSAPAAQYMLRKLVNSPYDAVIPFVGGMHQMLHAVYRPQRLLPSITKRLESGQYRLSGLLDEISWLGINEQEWKKEGFEYYFSEDVDTPEQYNTLLNKSES